MSRKPFGAVSVLTGGIDKHYAWGLATALAERGVSVDLVASPDMAAPETRAISGLRMVPLYAPPQGGRSVFKKALNYLRAYMRLLGYVATTSGDILHILWSYKFTFFDRTLLLLFYRLLGKKLVFTAHNVNAAERDANDSLWNRISLRMQYRLVDHIFVHTDKMRDQLVADFGVQKRKITVIPFGTYDLLPHTGLSPDEAKHRLGLTGEHRAVLFFGRITPYKGIDLLVRSFQELASRDARYRLIIAGEPMREAAGLWAEVKQRIEQDASRDRVLLAGRHIADSEIELYFNAADVIALPYTQIFQSGVLFMAYSYGLPAIATDVGSFARDIRPGVTGYLCRPGDPVDMARAIDAYFASDLYQELAARRPQIRRLVQESHSWEVAAGKTAEVYLQLRARPAHESGIAAHAKDVVGEP